MPRVSKVGDGWGGVQDYTTLSDWEAAEGDVDYGSAIVAQCKGSLGSIVNLSSTPVNGAEVYTDGIIFDGTNGDDLASVNTLTVSGNGYTIHDLKISSTNAFNRAFIISFACSSGNFDRLLVKPTVLNLQTDAFRVDCKSNSVVVRQVVVDGNGANDGVFFRYGDYCDIASITVINATDGLVGSSVSTTIVDSLVLGASRDIVTCKTITNCADSTTHSQADLVDPNNGDYRVKSSSDLVGLGIGAFFESGGGNPEIDLPVILAETNVYTPTVLVERIVELPIISAETAVYNATVLVSPKVEVPVIPAETQVFNPTVNTGPAVVNLPLILAETEVFEPEVGQPQEIEMELIVAPTAVLPMFIYQPGEQVQYEGIYYYGE